MKNFTKIVAMATIMIGAAITSNAQTDKRMASATAQATIIVPIQIRKTADLNFGNVIGTATGGTVVLSPAGVRTEDGVQLANTKGTVTAASFNVTGEPGYTYALTLPTADYTLTSTGTTPGTMTLTNFVSDVPSTPTITAGSVSFSVGATLNIGAAQIPGSYTNAVEFPVYVNYN